VAIIIPLLFLYLILRKNKGANLTLLVPPSDGRTTVSYKDTVNNVLRFSKSIVEIANAKTIDPALICAIIAIESEGIPAAKKVTRYETYYGLMQIAYKTAVWRGYKGQPDGLLNPDINIFYGSDYLAYQIRRYGKYSMSVSAYQKGYADVESNIAYVNKVAGFYYTFREYFSKSYSGYKLAYPDRWTA